MKYLPDNGCLVFIYHKVSHRLVLFVGSPLKLQAIAIRDEATTILSFLNHLGVLSAHADGGFLAFPGSLPEADIIQQLVNMGVESLLTFPGAPYFNTLLDKPLDDEGRFVCPGDQT